MTSVAKSIYFFGFYLLISGLTLFISPNFVLSLLSIPETTEIWIHLVGTLTFILGVFFIYTAKYEVRPFFFISMFGRGIFFVSILLLIYLYQAPVALILFGVVDILGLVWTLLIYKK